jgi:hypothetical protein
MRRLASGKIFSNIAAELAQIGKSGVIEKGCTAGNHRGYLNNPGDMCSAESMMRTRCGHGEEEGKKGKRD